MSDSNNVTPISDRFKPDPTNPGQIEAAARATLEAAERVLLQVRKERDDHRAWYRGIQENEQGRVDAIVREAAEKVVPEDIAKKAALLINSWVIEDVTRKCLDHVMMYADVQDVKRVGKAVKALTALFKGK
jgi:hypothetical protein